VPTSKESVLFREATCKPDEDVGFSFSSPKPSSHTVAQGLTQTRNRYQLRQANFLFWTELQYEKRKLACPTLYKYQKSSWVGGKTRLAHKSDNLSHLWADCPDNVGSSTSHNSIGLHGLLQGIALLYGDGLCFLWGTYWTVSTATSSQYLAVNCEPTVYSMWDS
jgi:hypothetical protein